MNELISINYDNPERPVVSGRELHKALKIETRYNDWFSRMCEYGFTENKNFYSILSKSTGGRPSIDHAITIPMAKELCMIQRTEIGRQLSAGFENILSVLSNSTTSPNKKNAVLSAILAACCIL